MYRKYFPIKTKWLRVKQDDQSSNTPYIISVLERASFFFSDGELYQVVNTDQNNSATEHVKNK